MTTIQFNPEITPSELPIEHYLDRLNSELPLPEDTDFDRQNIAGENRFSLFTAETLKHILSSFLTIFVSFILTSSTVLALLAISLPLIPALAIGFIFIGLLPALFGCMITNSNNENDYVILETSYTTVRYA